MQTLTTQRLILRQPKDTDVRDFHEYSTDPYVSNSVGWKPHSQMKESLSILHEFATSHSIWAIVDKLTNRMIGTIGLVDDPKRTSPKTKMIGYALHEHFWGQGLATEAAKAVIEYAFETLQLDLVSAYHYTYNKKSKSVIAKCGLRYEGVLRKATLSYQDGQPLDEACYSLTRQEYFQDKQNFFK